MPKEPENENDYSAYSTSDLREILLEKDSKILSCLELVRQMEQSEHFDLEKFKSLENKLRKYKDANAVLTDRNTKLHSRIHGMDAEIAKLSKLLDHQKLDYNYAMHQNGVIEG